MDLVVEYVQGLRPQGGGALNETDFLRATGVAAEACVVEELAPRAVDTELLRGVLLQQDVAFSDGDGEEVPPQKVVDQLVVCGLLERFVELAATRVRFTDDPIAEILCACRSFAAGGRNGPDAFEPGSLLVATTSRGCTRRWSRWRADQRTSIIIGL